MTITEQAALIPRPAFKGIETAPGHIEFHIAQKAVKAAVAPAVPAQVPAEAQPLPVWKEPTIKERIATWIGDSDLRLFDKKHGTQLYAAKLKDREENAQFLMAAQHNLIGGNGSLFYKRQLKHLVRGETG